MLAKPPQFTAQQMADALRQARGIKAAAARSLGCTRETVVRYCQKYPTVAAVCEEQREYLVDVAESHLTRWVDAGEERAVFWVLGTLGKDRGYVPRQEHTGEDGGPMRITFAVAPRPVPAALPAIADDPALPEAAG